MDIQQITKIMNYYRINHNYHSPYIFLIDGNFLKHLIQKNINNFQQKLHSQIPGKIKLRITNCIIQQLKLLGTNFIIILQKAYEIPLLKCHHHSSLSVQQCILSAVNKYQNIIICSQDKVLRRKLRYHNIPIMYFGPNQQITMQDIQKHQLKNLQQTQKTKYLPNLTQQQIIHQYKQKQSIFNKIKHNKQQLKLASQQGIELKHIKKKIIKGPNPLSIKKKSIKSYINSSNYQQHLISNQQRQEQLSTIIKQAHKEKRIRKRKKKITQENKQ